ncbi:hypothetical protein HBB16_11995 [Pseudonocardia sp. MCCB 268]|nr:hypothetical protein [Pseudonocardia cytotoxica]
MRLHDVDQAARGGGADAASSLHLPGHRAPRWRASIAQRWRHAPRRDNAAPAAPRVVSCSGVRRQPAPRRQAVSSAARARGGPASGWSDLRWGDVRRRWRWWWCGLRHQADQEAPAGRRRRSGRGSSSGTSSTIVRERAQYGFLVRRARISGADGRSACGCGVGGRSARVAVPVVVVTVEPCGAAGRADGVRQIPSP